MRQRKSTQVWQGRWNKWVDDGYEPKSSKQAEKILMKELAAISIDVSSSKTKNDLVRQLRTENGLNGRIATGASFAIWDLTENAGKALDYDVQSNYFSGLFEQARKLLSGVRPAMPVSVSEENIFKLRIPVNLSFPNVGSRAIESVPAATLERQIEKFIIDAKNRILMWKAIGADSKSVRKAIRKLLKEVMAEFGEVEEMEEV